MHISNDGLALIKHWEGFSAKPYWLGDGRWTIGYGDTLGVTKSTGPWSEAYAARKLKRRVRANFEPYVNRLHVHLNQHQHDAIVSLIYNLGPGVLDRGRSLGDALRSRKDAGWNARVRAAMMLYVSPGTQFEAGLTRRRREEAKLFAKPYVSPRNRKIARLQSELDRIRAEVRLKFKGDWGRTPKRKARADYIKHWLGSHPKV